MTEITKCEHGLPVGFCRECTKLVHDIMMEHAVRYGIGVVDIKLQKNIEQGDLFGIPKQELTATEARTRMANEEREHVPLPPWAIGRAKGELVLGAQLPTRDGRRCGNAHIVAIVPACDGIWQVNDTLYELLTDAGSTMQMTDGEVEEQFYPPVWVSDVDDVWRKFGPKDCCYKARETNGLKHRMDCDNY